jgi:glutamate-1-semialdehyde 2,1-aminomutase
MARRASTTRGKAAAKTAAAGAGPGRRTMAENYAIAERVLPGAGLAIYSNPDDIRFIVHRGEGARLQDVEGRWYLDYSMGASVNILGHAHPALQRAIADQCVRGHLHFGNLNEPVIDLARELVDAIPCAEQVMFGTTGSEANAYALRMARAFTGRQKVLKFEGGYHGAHDYSAISTFGGGVTNYPQGIPDGAGIPEAVRDSVLVSPFNDLEATRRIVAEHWRDLAAITVEPVQRNLPPREGFLEGLRALCDEYGVLLIFDEVISGFRLAWGGAQEYFGVTPHLAAYGKIIGGGVPLSCVAGPAEIVGLASPRRRAEPDYVFVNGTHCGNPLAAAAGLAALGELRQPGVYDRLNGQSEVLRREAQAVFDRHGLPVVSYGVGSFWNVLFRDGIPASHADMMAGDMASSREFDFELVRQGLYVLPINRRYLSLAHDDAIVEETLRRVDAACRVWKKR